MRNLSNLALVSLVTSWILCPVEVSLVRNQQVQGLSVNASQTLGSRRSRTEPPREELARTGRLLGTEQGRARHNPRGLCGVRRSRRDSARSLAWADCFRTPVVPNAAGGAALRYGKDVATTEVVSTWSAQRTRRRATQQRSQQAQTTPSSPSNRLRGVAKRQSRQTGP